MQTAQFTIAEARGLYNGSDDSGKRILEQKFGSKSFSGDITDIIKSLDDALSYKGVTLQDILSVVPAFRKKDEKFIHGMEKCSFIIEVLNEGWEADWADHSQYKYRPWFINNSGLGLSFIGSTYDGRHTTVASRLCLKSEKLSDYFGKTFLTEINEFMSK